MTGPDDRWEVQAHLAGVRVLEVGRGLDISFCGKLMADLGAEVTRLDLGEAAPVGRREPDASTRRLRDHLDRNKTVLAAESDWGLAQLQEAWSAVDCVLEDVGASGLERLELGGAASDGPRAVVRFSDWGQDSPLEDRQASGLVLQAAAGWVQARDHEVDEPVAVGGRYEVYAVGIYGAVAALTALEHARLSDGSTTTDVSRMACLHSTLAYPVTASEARDEEPGGTRRRRQPFGIMRCQDGWVGVNILTDQQWRSACELVDLAEFGDKRSELGKDEALLDGFQSRVATWLAERSVQDVVAQCQRARVPAVPVADAALMTSNPQFMARGFLPPDPATRVPRGPALPYVFTAPRADSAGVEVSERPPGAPVERSDRSATVAAAAGDSPFRGLRVLDLGCFWAGPYATCYLAGFGADVLKIESSRRPDGFRFVTPPADRGDRWYETSPLWQSTNLSKRSVTLDLTTPEGRAIFLRLVEKSDVVLENFSARVMDSFGLTYEHLAATNPGIIMVRMPGFGLSGPWRDYVGYGIAFEQIAGWAQVTGFRDGPPQTPGGYIDPIVGMHAVFAILAALRHRRHTGSGQLIELAQAEVGASLAMEQLLTHETGESPIGRNGNRWSGFAPQGVYRTADPTPSWVAITVRDDLQWHRLLGVLGEPVWAEGLGDADSRWQRHDEIDAELAAWARGHRAKEIVRLLVEADVPASPVQTPVDLAIDPTLAQRDYFRELVHPATGARRYAGYPMKFSFAESNPHRRAAPLLGEHSAVVLGELLGIGQEEFDELLTLGVVGRGWQPLD